MIPIDQGGGGVPRYHSVNNRKQVLRFAQDDRSENHQVASGAGGIYEGDPFDFVAAYLIPEDLWYIIPEEMIRGQGSIAVYPRLKKSKYGRYREAWNLLGAAGGGDPGWWGGGWGTPPLALPGVRRGFFSPLWAVH